MMSNESLIEEMLWIAYQSNLGITLAETVGEKIKNSSNKSRVQIYEESFLELGLKHNK
jgi:hypothetical protein